MPKLSINLSQPVHDRLGEMVMTEGPNASIVCEAALIMFERVPLDERRKILRQLLAERRPQTPRSWRALFWTALADEFGVPEMAGGAEQYLMAPRPYDGFQVIFDAQHALRPGHESEIVVFTDTAPPYTDRTRRIGSSWTFAVGESVFTAAHDVAEWIRSNKAQLVA
jgi:hypothetical protein